jgi:uncharacterized membrane protein YebE (DUF533 family)
MKNVLQIGIAVAVGVLGWLVFQKVRSTSPAPTAPVATPAPSASVPTDPWAQRLIAAGGALGGVGKLVDSIWD